MSSNQVPTAVQSQPYMPSSVSYERSINTIMSSRPFAEASQQITRTVITQEDRKWADEVMSFDPKLNRLRYSISNPSARLSSQSRLILEEAFKVNRFRLNGIRDEDYEFIGVIAEVIPDLVKSCFQEWGNMKSIPKSPSSTPCKKPMVYKKDITRATGKRSKGSSCELLQESNENPVTKRLEKLAVTTTIVRKIIPSQHQALQRRSCMASRNMIECCRACISSTKGSSEECQFENFRYFYVESQKDAYNPLKYKFGPDFFSDPSEDPNFRFYRIDLNKDESDYILSYIHQKSQDLVQAEIKHMMDAEKNMDDSGNKYVRRPSHDRQHCEICEVSILTLCSKQVMHHKEQFVPCGRFHLSTLVRSLDSLNTRVQELPPHLIQTANSISFELSNGSKSIRSREKMEYLEPLISHHDNMTNDMFRDNWRQGRVILLSGTGERLKKDWSPEYLKRRHGNVTVSSLDIRTQETKDVKLKQYFDNYFVGYPTNFACKMMEWPMEPFQEVLEDHFLDLLQALPVPEYTRLRGVFNLVRYFPIGQIGVDLSPKLYASQGLGSNCMDYGSISTSCEMSDSIYICVYTGPMNLEGSENSGHLEPSVIWDVYRSEDRHFVEEYLENQIAPKKRSERSKLIDPFGSHETYLSPQDQKQLYRKTGARPYQVCQNLGDAIMIPAGCVRQARYIQDAILVGLDFVSPERFEVTLQWQKESRETSLKKNLTGSLDVLMAKDILFYSTLAII
ncbi:hypothetical protein BGZ76_011444 [Entomortierella beljakovae]|nr:hypothetical protein BGZ76_011444 [Entomortierella beljakovae]